MPLPSFEKYNQAFQVHSLKLFDPELKKGDVSKTVLGLPFAISGGFALTYTIQSGQNKYAVRCFHREAKGLGERYKAISERLNTLSSPYFLDFQYQPQGIRVDDTDYPIVKMAWAQGDTLGTFLENNRKDKVALSNLTSSLAALGAYLAREQIAHGDLQPDNLMVSEKGKKLQLIDYDGMYVDAIQALGSAELGQINFQHPQRKSINPFDANLDRFSLITLSLALKTLQKDPSIWDRSNSEVNAVVFRANDFIDPAASKVFAMLMALPALVQDTENFAAICKSPVAQVPSLEDFLAGKNIPLVTGNQPTVSTTQCYLGVYDVLAASNYNGCLKRVGDKVEVIGQIVEVSEKKTKYKSRYVFINFGDWEGKIFKITLWSEGLKSVSNPPDTSWEGKWVSVIGLMEPPYAKSTKSYSYTHLSITVTTNGQLSLISETEAKRRLAGQVSQAKAPLPHSPLLTAQPTVSGNQNIIDNIKKNQRVATAPLPKPVSGNQNVINNIRKTQSPPPKNLNVPTTQSNPHSSTGCSVWVFAGITFFFIWIFSGQEGKNTAPVITAPSQTAYIQQTTPSRTDSIADHANDLYEQGRYTEAYPLVEQMAKGNYPNWQRLLGNMYENGQGVQQDYHLAKKWYQKAADQGREDAVLALKELRRKEQQSESNALKAHFAAITAVHPDLDEIIKDPKFNDWVVSQPKKLRAQYGRIRKKGTANEIITMLSAYKLDIREREEMQTQIQQIPTTHTITPEDVARRAYDLYELGRYDEALPLYQQAAEQGLASAQYNLGVMYHTGHGVAKDISTAIYWYRKAADQGSKGAIKVMSEFNIKARNEQQQNDEAPLFARDRESFEAEVLRRSPSP
jgi:TPR repeat protein